jgi:ABC-2 type transport system permease protein
VPFLRSLDTLGEELPAAIGDGDAEEGAFEWQPFTIEKADIIRQRSGPQNAYAVSFPQGAVWALIGCTTAFALSIVIERARGTMGRLRLAPISYAHILAGKALACFITLLAVLSLLLLVARFAFEVIPSSLPLLVAAVLCSGVCFVGLMMLLAVMGRTEAAAGGIGWAVMLAFAMIGGGMVPLFIMPGWMQQASVVSPVRWAVLALEGAIWRDFTPAEMLTPCLVMLGIGAVAFAIGASLFKRMEAA